MKKIIEITVEARPATDEPARLKSIRVPPMAKLVHWRSTDEQDIILYFEVGKDRRATAHRLQLVEIGQLYEESWKHLLSFEAHGVVWSLLMMEVP